MLIGLNVRPIDDIHWPGRFVLPRNWPQPPPITATSRGWQFRFKAHLVLLTLGAHLLFIHRRERKNLLAFSFTTIKSINVNCLHVIVKMQLAKLMLLINYIMCAREGVIFVMDNTGNGSALIKQAAIKQDELLLNKFNTDKKMLRDHYKNESLFIESNRINFINLSTISQDLLHQTEQLKSRSKI